VPIDVSRSLSGAVRGWAGRLRKFAAKIRTALGLCSLCALASCSAGTSPAAHQHYYSDDFTKDAAIGPEWTIVQPNPLSRTTLTADGLSLVASGQNGGSDFWPRSNYNASLLLRPLPAGDWVATTAIDYDPSNDFSGAGLILTTELSGFSGTSPFHRFEYERNHFQNSPSRGVEDFSNLLGGGSIIPFSGTTIFLRLEKAGIYLTIWASADGRAWQPGYTVVDTTPYTYIGLISARQPSDGATTVDSAPVFKFFTLDTAAMP
jgi:hypothetical protein